MAQYYIFSDITNSIVESCWKNRTVFDNMNEICSHLQERSAPEHILNKLAAVECIQGVSKKSVKKVPKVKK